MTVPLAVRRRSPLLVACLVLGAFAAQSLLPAQLQAPSSVLATIVAVYTVAAYEAFRGALLGAAVAAAAVGVSLRSRPAPRRARRPRPGSTADQKTERPLT